MGDLLIQIVVLPLALVCSVICTRVSGRLLNPVTIISFGFFLPMVAATLRLSGLQNNSWAYDTYASIWLIVASWLVFPALVLMIKGKATSAVQVSENLSGASFLFFYRAFAAFIITSFLISNYIQAGTVLPILFPEIANKIHTEFPPILRLFARCIPAVVGLAYMAYAMHRRKLDIFILCFALVIPLTRLSRIDVMLSLVVLAVVFFAKPLFKLRLRTMVLGVVLGAAVAIGSAELGNQRTNRFGMYEIKYDNAVKWLPASSGPAGVLAVLYGYFPLSFENFDTFVRQTTNERAGGLLSFDWFFSGVIKLNRFGAGLEKDSNFTTFAPVSSAANVPTALLPFYGDFGIAGMVFPAALYMALWLYLFYKSSSGVNWLLAYGVYTAAYSLSSFQAIMSAAFIFHQIVFVFILCFIAATTQRAYSRRNTPSRKYMKNRALSPRS